MRRFFHLFSPLRNPVRDIAALGVIHSAARYDLPLTKSSGNSFLRLLIGMMSVLALLATLAFFALSAMTERWASGLEGKFSVEIPAADSGGEIIGPGIVKGMTEDAAKILSQDPSVEKADIMTESEIRNLLSPWLGEDMAMDSIPVPGLISVTLKKGLVPDFKVLEAKVKETAPRARLDTHQGWLTDLLRFTRALKFSAIVVIAIVGAATLIAVAGGVRAKLSENKEELALLHIMGATDSYIAGQLQKHTFILALQGGFIGIGFGAAVALVISLIAGKMDLAFVPDFHLGLGQISIQIVTPILLAALAMLTARYTVLRVLAKMP